MCKCSLIRSYKNVWELLKELNVFDTIFILGRLFTAFMSAWKRVCKSCLTKLQNYKRVITTIYVFDIMFCFENIKQWSNNACVNTPYSCRNICWVHNKFEPFVISIQSYAKNINTPSTCLVLSTISIWKSVF
jgi:hypothetical protein